MNKDKILLLLTERKKFLLLISTIFLLLVLSLYLLLTRKKEDPFASKETFPSPTLVEPTLVEELPETKVGNDSFSQEDLKYLANVYLSNKNLADLTVDEKEYLEDLALERFLVIQEVKKRNLITVDDTLLSPNKDWEQYNKIYEEAKKAIISQEEQISVAGIFMYFYNQFPPKMGVEKAKEVTRNKMEKIRSDLASGKIDFKQAAEIIANDTLLSEIDPIYYANAYSEFNNRNKTRQIVSGISAKDNNLLWSLNTGEYSPIILGHESGNDVVSNEAYWAIFQVTSKTGSEKPYLEWLKGAKKDHVSKNN